MCYKLFFICLFLRVWSPNYIIILQMIICNFLYPLSNYFNIVIFGMCRLIHPQLAKTFMFGIHIKESIDIKSNGYL